ncbi:MAG: hypothetical protein R2867_29485 [Caldilineaceae bacterium]
MVNRAPLVDLPEPVLPAGYTIRATTGVDEVAALVAVHVGAFGSTWTPELYRKVMESPGYAAEREFVVVAPDGAFAALTVTWHDEVNRTGLFEPVGTHRDLPTPWPGQGAAFDGDAQDGCYGAGTCHCGQRRQQRSLAQSLPLLRVPALAPRRRLYQSCFQMIFADPRRHTKTHGERQTFVCLRALCDQNPTQLRIDECCELC